MTTIQKTQDGTFILNNENLSVRAMFNNWKIWLTKKELSDIYWVKKSDIKKELNNLVLNSNIDFEGNIKRIFNKNKDKNETFYSLDILLVLWYQSKHFKETKFLVNTNKIIKKYTSSRKHRMSKFYSSPMIGKIINYFDSTLKTI